MDEDAMDYTLATLVSVTNSQGDSDFYVGVTLSVRGLVVSGLLVPNFRWMKLAEEQLGSAVPATEPDGVAGHGLAAIFTATRQNLERLRDEEKSVADALSALEQADELPDRYREFIAEQEKVGYIHLRDARYFHPAQTGGAMPSEGMLWRGRLTEIDGWSMGNFTMSSQ